MRLEPIVSTNVVIGMVIVVVGFVGWREECSPEAMELEIEGLGVNWAAELSSLVLKLDWGSVEFAE